MFTRGLSRGLDENSSSPGSELTGYGERAENRYLLDIFAFCLGKLLTFAVPKLFGCLAVQGSAGLFLLNFAF